MDFVAATPRHPLLIPQSIKLCEPAAIATIGITSLSAAFQKVSSDRAVTAQAQAANANTAVGYRVAQESDRNAQAEAFEAQTDLTRNASTAIQANQNRFMSFVDKAGVSYGVDKYKKETEIEAAENAKR